MMISTLLTKCQRSFFDQCTQGHLRLWETCHVYLADDANIDILTDAERDCRIQAPRTYAHNIVRIKKYVDLVLLALMHGIGNNAQSDILTHHTKTAGGAERAIRRYDL